MEERAMTDAFDPLGIVAGLVAHGVTYVLVGALAAQKQGAAVQADQVDICVPGDQANLVRLALALEQLRARQIVSESQDEHRASFDTQIGRLDLIEDSLSFAALDAKASNMNIGRGVVAHVASLEDLARSDTGSVDVAAATAMLVALAEAPEAERPVGKRAHKFSMPARAPKPEKAPKPVKVEKAPKAENAPKAEKAPKPEKAEKAPKPPKQAKGDRLRLVDRVLEKLESVDSFLNRRQLGKAIGGGQEVAVIARRLAVRHQRACPAARTGAALKSFRPCIASFRTIAGLFSLLGAHEVRVWPPGSSQVESRFR